MTLGIFIGTIICAIIAVGATIGCLVFLYKYGGHHYDSTKFAGASFYCGIIAATAIFGVFALTHNAVWAFII